MDAGDLQICLGTLSAPRAEPVEAWRIGRQAGSSFDKLRMRLEMAMARTLHALGAADIAASAGALA
jgi:hypothetical protein